MILREGDEVVCIVLCVKNSPATRVWASPLHLSLVLFTLIVGALVEGQKIIISVKLCKSLLQ